jgi:hypothetical protein
MKSKIIFTILLAVLLSFFGFGGSKDSTEIKQSILLSDEESGLQFRINFIKGDGYNYPTFALWLEDMQGNYLKTLYITQSYASGVFGNQKVGDSIWKPLPGPSYQPAALPYWTHKKGLIKDQTLVPNPEDPFVDAYTGATPENNFEIIINEDKNENFKLIFEVNQAWDFNRYWTNNKFPESEAYKNSAQPSLVYEAALDPKSGKLHMQAIGHGDPKGESGQLFSDITTLSTAKEIFESIKIKRIVN